MRQEHGRILEALDAVEAFLGENTEALGDAVFAAAHRHLRASRERMAQHVTAQESFTRDHLDGVVGKQALREVLVRDHIRPIAAIGRALLPEVGELKALRVPVAKGSYVAIVAAAYGIADVAKKHEAALLAAGRPAGFIAELVAATDALRDAVNATRQVKGQRMEATAGLVAEAKVARRALGLVDTLVRASIKGDRALLARWTHIRRVTSGSTSGPDRPTVPSTPAAA
jgi:hypothetical protein